MSYTPVKSRENLQRFTKNYLELEKYTAFNSLLKRIWDGVRNTVAEGKTKYIFKPDNLEHILFTQKFVRSYNNLITRQTIHLEFLDILRKEYPDCTIDYCETKGHEGTVVERIFEIDWSVDPKPNIV